VEGARRDVGSRADVGDRDVVVSAVDEQAPGGLGGLRAVLLALAVSQARDLNPLPVRSASPW
jgi:hypothetical protein